MMTKLPEPDDSSTEIEAGISAYWFRLETVRAIQEEAYKAGMASVRERWQKASDDVKSAVLADSWCQECALEHVAPAVARLSASRRSNERLG